MVSMHAQKRKEAFHEPCSSRREEAHSTSEVYAACANSFAGWRPPLGRIILSENIRVYPCSSVVFVLLFKSNWGIWNCILTVASDRCNAADRKSTRLNSSHGYI